MFLALFSIDDLSIKDSISFFQEENQSYMGLLAVGHDEKIYKFSISQLIEYFEVEKAMGQAYYEEFFSKPIFFIIRSTKEDEFFMSKADLDKRIRPWQISVGQLVNVFALGCWLVKDCSIQCKSSFLINPIIEYYQKNTCLIDTSTSQGNHRITSFSEKKIHEALNWMEVILPHFYPPEADISPFEPYEWESSLIDINSHIAGTGTNFYRTLYKIQEARASSSISTKIDRYCSALECLYCLEQNHKAGISTITANFLKCYNLPNIQEDMKDAYGIRSDSSHGDELKYLKKHNRGDMIELCTRIDDYVRHVLRDVFVQKELNYGNGIGDKQNVKDYFEQFLST